MNTSFKILSFMFFIPLLLLVPPLHSQAEEGVSTPAKDIRIIENPYEFGDKYNKDKAGKCKVVTIDVKGIKERILNGKPVCFVEVQDDEKKTIKSEWITNALKVGNHVIKIDIKNAIITGDLDFHIKENLVDIDKSGIEEDDIESRQSVGREKVHLISTSIDIENCELQGKLEAGTPTTLFDIIFEKPVRFYDSTFLKYTTFDSAVFMNMANFRSANFRYQVSFSGTVFYDIAKFGSADFDYGVDFSSARFEKYAGFRCRRIGGSFYEAIFNGYADFALSSFGGADFTKVEFNDDVGFWSTRFKHDAIFEETKFEKNANFKEASFGGVADFDNASFEKNVDFIGTIFSLNVDLRNTNYATLKISWDQLAKHLDGFLFGKEASVWLSDSSFSGSFPKSLKYKIRYKGPNAKRNHITFRGVMSEEEKTELQELSENQEYKDAIQELFYRAEDSNDEYDHGIFNSLEEFKKSKNKRSDIVEHQDIKLPDSLSAQGFTMWKQMYLRLIKNFEDIGDKKSADDAFYHYRSAKPIFHYEADLRSGKKYIVGTSLWWKSIEYVCLNLTCGYGTKPLRPLGVGGMLVLLFTLGYFIPFFFKVKSLVYQQGKDNTDSEENEKWYHCLYNSFYFSVMTFTTVGYGDYSPKRIFKIVAMLEGVLGWLTLALFLVTLGNVWLR